jgi:FAD/FMN-containing dehydrogenase
MAGRPPAVNDRAMRQTMIGELEDEGFGGEVVGPGEPSYDALRRVFNGMIDRRPAVIARCTGAADVIAAIRYARDRDLPVAVHGGGHGVGGHAVCDGGLMIDLRPMKGVRIDRDRRIAHVQAGLTWGGLDRETQAFGLAVTGGRMSTTGVAGFTLGSGSGWLERKLGLAADNLISADVVLADGSFVTASETQHPDLFWGLRGGGGNFGVVTAFEFQLHPIGPTLLGGMLVHPEPRAAEVLRFFRDFMADAPDEVGAAVALTTAPAAPFVPKEARGKPAVGIITCYAGPIDEGERVLRPLREFGPPLVDRVAPMPYTEIQRLIDPSAPSGMQNWWGGDFHPELSDGLIDAFAAAAAAVPSPLSLILIVPGGGAIARVPEDVMALGQREMAYNSHLISMWADPADRARNIAWLRELQAAIRPYSSGRSYVNFLTDADEHRVRAAFGPETYARLAEIKERYDPENVFRLNQNVRPRKALGV